MQAELNLVDCRCCKSHARDCSCRNDSRAPSEARGYYHWRRECRAYGARLSYSRNPALPGLGSRLASRASGPVSLSALGRCFRCTGSGDVEEGPRAV